MAAVSARSRARTGKPFAAGAIGAFALIVLSLVFFALMAWQIERRAWKLDLIARVDARVAAPAKSLPSPDFWNAINAADDEYRHVEASGNFVAAPDTLVQAVTDLGAGYWVMSPLRQADGSIVMINRGFVSQGVRPESAMTGQPVTVRGLLRMTEPGGGFLRHNDPPADRWYSRDAVAIAAARGLSGDPQKVAPFFIDQEAGGPAAKTVASDATPVPGLTVIAFHNSHLVYALTWCTLALMAAAAAWYIIRLEHIDAGTEAAGRD